MARIKVRRTNREELPGVAVLRDASVAGLPAYSGRSPVLDLDMDVDPNLTHLITHDPDGFFTALDREETVGFAAAHVRSRQWILSELWVLEQHRGKGAGSALLRRVLMYGERSGAREFMALVPTESSVQSLLLKNDFVPVTPVYVVHLTATVAEQLGPALSGLMSGTDVTAELLKRRGHADLDRLDRVTRNISREVDHNHWLKERGIRAAFIRQGDRIAAYAYADEDQVGPVAGSTPEAALAALGWAITLAVKTGYPHDLVLRVPARFSDAMDHLLDGGARVSATMLLYGRGVSQAFDRSVFGAVNLP